LVALVTSKEGMFEQEQILPTVIYTLCALLLFGSATLLRILKRDQVTDEYKDAMDTIRNKFKEWDVKLADYQPLTQRSRKVFAGGLTVTVILINSLIAGALVALLLRIQYRVSDSLGGTLGLGGAAALQLAVKSRFNRRMDGLGSLREDGRHE
jgi:hypothetical protein